MLEIENSTNQKILLVISGLYIYENLIWRDMNSLVFANQSSATNCWLTTPLLEDSTQHPPSGPASPQVDSFSGLLRLLGELVTFVVGLLGELITSHSPHQVIDIPELSGPTIALADRF